MKIVRRIIRGRLLFGFMLCIVLTLGFSSLQAEAAAKLNKKSATLTVGQTVKLKVSGTKKKVKWSSSKTSVCTVNQSGTVKAKKKGTATIKAKVANKTLQCKVTVTNPKLNKTSVTLTAGQTAQLKVTGAKGTVTWSSSKTSVCTVNQSGTITAKAKGTATIKAKVTNKTLQCKVTVNAKTTTSTPTPTPTPAPTPTPTPVTPTGITVTGAVDKIAPGGTVQLRAVFTPANATGKVKWSTSSSSRATVSEDGLVTAKGTGNVTITAELESNWRINGSYTLTVENLVVDGEVTTEDGGDLLLSVDSSRAVYNYTVSYLVPNVQTQVLDAVGTVVRTYPMGTLSPNSKASVSWDLKNSNGNQVSPGTYCFQVVAAGAVIKSSYFTVYANSEFGIGNGSAESPYEVSNLDQLQKVREHNGAYFKQTADIDLDYQAFSSLFTKDVPFTGTYDGDGYVIKNIINTKDGEENIAVFTAIGANGTVQNMVIDACTFNGKANVSAIAGINEGNIRNCVVKNSNFVSSNGRAGGIAGENAGTIQGCKTGNNNISATASSTGTGGICGYSKGAIISCSSTSDTIGAIVIGWGNLCAGGIVGYSEGNILSCEVTSATLNGTRTAGDTNGGGVAGYNSGTVTGCKVSGLTVEGSWNAKGGIIGWNKAINSNNVYDGSLNQVGA